MDWFFRQLTTASETRRARIHATGNSLPTVDDTTLHLVLVGSMAAFVGLVVFVTVALDHPFPGAVTPAPDGFNLIADRPFGGLSRTGD